MSPVTARKIAPDDLAISCADDCCWSAHGWESAAESSVQSAESRTRGQARAAFAFECGDITSVGAWKRYIRPRTVQEQWEYYHDDEPGPPEGWYSEDACWEFVPKDSPGICWPVWVCGLRVDGPPQDPKPIRGSLATQAPTLGTTAPESPKDGPSYTSLSSENTRLREALEGLRARRQAEAVRQAAMAVGDVLTYNRKNEQGAVHSPNVERRARYVLTSLNPIAFPDSEAPWCGECKDPAQCQAAMVCDPDRMDRLIALHGPPPASPASDSESGGGC